MSIFFNAEEIVKMAVKTEELGCEFYKTAIKNASSAELKELFSYLAREELKHKEIFSGMLGTIAEAAQGVPADWDAVNDYIKAMLADSIFYNSEGNIGKAVLAEDENSALENAIKFEKETLLFFYQLLEIVKENARPAISAIIAEEKTHIQKLIKIRKNIS